MSSPPSYGSVTETNPDVRPLPPGWMQQYDPNYKTWFYVDTNTQPPATSWTHPADRHPPPPGPPPNQYQPPQGQPPERNQQWGSQDQYGLSQNQYGLPPQNQQSIPQNQYGQSQGQWGIPNQQSWGGSFPQGPGYGQPQDGWSSQPSNEKDKKNGKDKKAGGLMGLLGPLKNSGGGSGHSSGSGYGGQGFIPGFGGGQGQSHGGYGYGKPPKKKQGGMGGAGMLAAGAGAGLLGGLLVADAIDDIGDGFDGGGDFDF